MTTSFFLIFFEHPWDKLRANLLYLWFLANNCLYSSHTDIKLCTYCLYRYTTALIREILYLAYQLWSIDFLTPPTPLIIPHRLPVFVESLWLSKTDPRFMQDAPKAIWSIPFVSVAFFPSIKQIVFLKFTSCNNRDLVEYIPIAAVAIHLNLKS